MKPRDRKRRLSHEGRIVLLAVLAGMPGAVAALGLLWFGHYPAMLQWSVTAAVVVLWGALALAVRERVVFPLQTLASLLSALREGDFSVRGQAPRPDDALGEVMREVNTLADILMEQRLGAMEATTLLRTVMKQIDVAIFAFDDGQQLRLVNGAGERLLGRPAERLIGTRAAELDLADCLAPQVPQTFQRTFPGGSGRWGIRRSTVREHGFPLKLLVISDLTQTLREQELQAWQRLVRVLGHELNNSLTPIKSISTSLGALVARDTQTPDWQDDMRRGLAVIESRAEALSRFVGAYTQLARLPKPKLQPLDVSSWVERVARLETRIHIEVRPGPLMVVPGDADQLEQVLINLLSNATDASLETGGGVRVGWRRDGQAVELVVEDDGPGLANPGNLFVPFFTTKPGGSGIGLVLSRQIAEAHGGSLTLENRPDARGSVARLRLPT